MEKPGTQRPVGREEAKVGLSLQRLLSGTSESSLSADVEDEKKRIQEKLADGITRVAGCMAFFYLHIVLFGLWNNQSGMAALGELMRDVRPEKVLDTIEEHDKKPLEDV